MRSPRIQIYRDSQTHWRWRFIAGNGKVLADSGQGYNDKRDCIHGLELVTGARVRIGWGRHARYQQGWLHWPVPLGGETREVFIVVLG